MRRRVELVPTRVVLLMLGVGIVALMGVPGFGRYHPPEGAVTGIVRGPDGEPLGGIEVALFSNDDVALVALTRTDSFGHFAFPQAPEHHSLFARPAAESDLVGAWVVTRTRTPTNAVELDLERGAPLTVNVLDGDGAPLPGCELRIYDSRGEPAVVARLRTDDEGRAKVLAPRRIHLAALSPGRAPYWSFAETLPDEGRELTLVLRSALAVEGRVLDERGDSVAGVIVTAWESGDDERWRGYARTDEEGRFRLATLGGPTRLRAVDPRLEHLPVEVEVPAGPVEELALPLPSGAALEVRCLEGTSEIPSRVWIWSAETGTWGWGARTGPDGILRVRVAERYGVVAEPEGDGRLQVQAWGRQADGPALELSWPLDG